MSEPLRNMIEALEVTRKLPHYRLFMHPDDYAGVKDYVISVGLEDLVVQTSNVARGTAYYADMAQIVHIPYYPMFEHDPIADAAYESWLRCHCPRCGVLRRATIGMMELCDRCVKAVLGPWRD